jgi:hypothetical protein
MLSSAAEKNEWNPVNWHPICTAILIIVYIRGHRSQRRAPCPAALIDLFGAELSGSVMKGLA